ncbi:MAG: adenosylmethionine decarboxylase [Candidatus Wildermuthbacteria bacterium]|nr:adenosylmethionine decarboxylase [Candidatus Wildermuthbacteria bacterium]
MEQTKRVPRWAESKIGYGAGGARYAGRHIVADFWFGKQIETAKELRQLLRASAKAGRATVLKLATHSFSPQGFTGVVLLSESHIAVHTWPEIGYVAVDVFTCGKESRPMRALRYMQEYLNPDRVVMREMKRGALRQKTSGLVLS